MEQNIVAPFLSLSPVYLNLTVLRKQNLTQIVKLWYLFVYLKERKNNNLIIPALCLSALINRSFLSQAMCLTDSTVGQLLGFWLRLCDSTPLHRTWIPPKNCSSSSFPPDLLLSLTEANCLFIAQIGWCLLISKFSKSHSLKPSFILPTPGNVTGSLTMDFFGSFVGFRKPLGSFWGQSWQACVPECENNKE